MLSLLRWGLGSGSESLTEKEKLRAVERPSPKGKMAAGQNNKRKRANTASHRSSSAKQAKRHAGSSAKVLIANDKSPKDASPLQNFADQVAASVKTPDRVPFTSFASTTAGKNTDATPADALQSEPQQDVAHPVQHITLNAPAIPKVADMDRVQQMIEEQFSLEILLKHREIRLIDQEIAKCQVSLEQLRRCQAIPYPSQSGKVQDMLDVAGGIGQPMRTRHSRQPTQPTPWGIAEGPYSRHYSQWLIPDPTFDGGNLADYHVSFKGANHADRQTRGGKTDSKPRSNRSIAESRLQSLPSGYPAAKEDKGLAILKRHLDGKMVKLYCSICDRYDFSSAQGFINHYRIAHDKNLKSHEQAAQVCGVELGANETVATPGPSTAGVQTPAGALVHAFNRPSAHIPQASSVPTLSTPVPRKKRGARPAYASDAQSIPPLESSTALLRRSGVQPKFKPSHETPHLSKAFASAGHGGDFAALVSEMKEKLVEPPLPEEDHQSDSEQEGATTPVATHMSRIPSSGGQRNVIRGGYLNVVGMRPQSKKGPERSGRRGTAMRADQNGLNLSTMLELPEQPHDLSPHTVESNNAPSLTSDSDDEYRNGSSTAPSSHGSDHGENDHMDVDVEVEELDREREEHEEHRAEPISSKSDDPELRASGTAKVKAPRRAVRAPPAKPDPPRKRGRPRKVQPK